MNKEEANAKLAELVETAQVALTAAEQFADEHDLTFRFITKALEEKGAPVEYYARCAEYDDGGYVGAWNPSACW